MFVISIFSQIFYYLENLSEKIGLCYFKTAYIEPSSNIPEYWNNPGYYEIIITIADKKYFESLIDFTFFNYSSNQIVKGVIGFYYSNNNITRISSSFCSENISSIISKKYFIKNNQLILRIATSKSFLNCGYIKVFNITTCTSNPIINCEFKYYPGIKELPTEGTDF